MTPIQGLGLPLSRGGARRPQRPSHEEEEGGRFGRDGTGLRERLSAPVAENFHGDSPQSRFRAATPVRCLQSRYLSRLPHWARFVRMVPGNGGTIGFTLDTPERVDAWHAAHLKRNLGFPTGS
jgi:hypothetical protein